MKRVRGAPAVWAVPVILWSLLLIWSSVLVRAQTSNYPETVRVGYFDYAGFIEKDRNGEFSGYGYDYLEEISTYTGWKYEFVYGTWDECLRRLATGEIDLLCTAQFTPERAKLYDYAKFDSGVEYGALFVSKDNNSVFYEDIASFDGLKIAFLKDSYQNILFEAYAKEHGFTYSAVDYDTSSAASRALADGEVDAVLMGSLRKTTYEKVVAKFAPEPFYFITTKGNSDVLSGINTAMEGIRTKDINFGAKLYDKYYGPSVTNQMAFTREEHNYIVSHPRLRMAYLTSWNPIEYENPETEEFDGISAGFMEKISQASGITFDLYPVEFGEDAINLVSDGEAELISAYPRSQLQIARENGLFLTKAYYDVPVALAKREVTPVSELKIIAVSKASPGLQRFVQNAYPTAEIKVLPDVQMCLNAVMDYRADAVFGNTYILDQFQKDVRYNSLETVLPMEASYPICIGVSEKQDILLLSILNKAIAQISGEEENKIIVSNTVTGPRLDMEALIQRYGLPVALIIAMIIVLVVLKSRRMLERYAFIDSVNGYRNQTKFALDAQKVLNGRSWGCYAVLYFDLNKFKLINDLNGFEAGTRILVAISDMINSHLSLDELFCRAGSDHFITLLHCADQEMVADKAVVIIQDVCKLPEATGRSLQFTVSSGLYLLEKESDIHTAIERANFARQSAKKSHKYQISYYNASMRDQILREQEIESSMEEALEAKEFVVYYQPKYNIYDRRVIGAEALIRWKRADGTMIFPDEFIPLFESNGFIVRLDIYVFEQVCKQLRIWLNKGYYPYPVSVNLSRVHLYQPDFYKRYLMIRDQYQIPAYLLELELTENAIFDNKAVLISVMKELRNAGISLSMDDFGSGYSSLNLLKDMPIDFLKIDREFFNLSSDTERGKKIIMSIVSMAKQLEISVISEGVETVEQAEFLQEIQCDIAQGYFYSRPISVEEFEKLAFWNQEHVQSENPVELTE